MLAHFTVALILATSSVQARQSGGDADSQVATPATPSPEEVNQSVEKARHQLRGGLIKPTRPWYDAKTDGVRRLDLRVEAVKNPPNLNFSWFPYFLSGLGWLGLALLLGGLIFLLVHVYLRRERRPDGADAAPPLDDRTNDIDRVEALPFRMARQTTDLLNEARRQYEQGNYSEAIVYLFSHQLVELDRQHLIHLARGKTNRQLVRELGSRRELRLLVEQTMVAFEDVFFGDHMLSRSGFEACWFELERFDRLVQEAAP